MEASPEGILPELYAELRNLSATRPANLMTAAYGETPLYDDGPASPLSWLDIDGTIREPQPGLRPMGRWTNSNDYSCMGYPPERLRACVKALARDLPGIMARYNADAVVVRGGSGVVFGGALLMVSDIKVIVARKPGEQSHSTAIEVCGGGSLTVHRYIVLDDFVSSGGTVKGIMDDMGQQAECVGVIEYRYAEQGQPCEPNPLDTYHLETMGKSIMRLAYRRASGGFY